MGRLDLLEEPGPAFDDRRGADLPQDADRSGASEVTVVIGSLLSGRHADRRMGFNEELRAERRLGQAARPAGRNGERDFHKETRSNETHGSTTDPDARLFRKGNGKESRLCFLGHTLMENRNGLIVDCQLSHATGTAERDTALVLIDRNKPRSRRITLGADKLFDTQGFITALRTRKVTPHIAIDGRVSKLGVARSTAMDGRTTRHPGYEISQRIRKRIEEGFGWAKTIGGMAKVKVRGLAKAAAAFTFTMAAYNIIRIPKLLQEAA